MFISQSSKVQLPTGFMNVARIKCRLFSYVMVYILPVIFIIDHFVRYLYNIYGAAIVDRRKVIFQESKRDFNASIYFAVLAKYINAVL